jgi:hypothetical protein
MDHDVDPQDDLLILALAGGASVAEAAAKANLSKRTAFRRLEDPAFRARVAEARTEMFAQATGRLAELAREAADALGAMLSSESEQIRLGVCRAILAMGPELREHTELAQQLQEMRQQLERVKHGDSAARNGEAADGTSRPDGDGHRALGSDPQGPGGDPEPGEDRPGRVADGPPPLFS